VNLARDRWSKITWIFAATLKFLSFFARTGKLFPSHCIARQACSGLLKAVSQKGGQGPADAKTSQSSFQVD
ncbi:hypothetical protein, partial [Pseudomonas syringae group genomosp. 7]|uniref:hypothetical protein n=1 Tax=Pseudomonas syringae group genomosp. 7 TaxID=251699 RepID=UPI003770525F